MPRSSPGKKNPPSFSRSSRTGTRWSLLSNSILKACKKNAKTSSRNGSVSVQSPRSLLTARGGQKQSLTTPWTKRSNLHDPSAEQTWMQVLRFFPPDVRKQHYGRTFYITFLGFVFTAVCGMPNGARTRGTRTACCCRSEDGRFDWSFFPDCVQFDSFSTDINAFDVSPASVLFV